MISMEDEKGRRWYEDGIQRYLSVTTAIQLIAELSGERGEYDGLPSEAMRIHRAEGNGCHQAALNWLALQKGWITEFVPPIWPAGHPDLQRWKNIMTHALNGIAEWSHRRQFIVDTIEQPSICPVWGFAGCPDCSGTLLYQFTPRKVRRIPVVVELKFTAELLDSHRTQVCSYGLLDDYRRTKKNPSGAVLGFLLRIDRNNGDVEEEVVRFDSRPREINVMKSAINVLRYTMSKRMAI